jgi:hypothetical protein
MSTTTAPVPAPSADAHNRTHLPVQPAPTETRTSVGLKPRLAVRRCRRSHDEPWWSFTSGAAQKCRKLDAADEDRTVRRRISQSNATVRDGGPQRTINEPKEEYMVLLAEENDLMEANAEAHVAEQIEGYPLARWGALSAFLKAD